MTARSVRTPLSRRREIEAAVAAYNATEPDMLLPPEAAHLLSVMFRRSGVCQRSLVDLAAEVNEGPRAVDRLLRFLTAIGFLSTEYNVGGVRKVYGGVPNIYRLHLPPVSSRRRR
jgi:hypothetical protein